jgi:hypothetical protein
MAAPPEASAIVALVRLLEEALARDDATAASVAAATKAGEVEDDGAPLGVRARPDVAGVEQVTVTRRWESELPNAAEIHLTAGLALADVERLLGASRKLRSPRPGDRRVAFEATGEATTTLGAIDADGDLRSLTVRREG